MRRMADTILEVMNRLKFDVAGRGADSFAENTHGSADFIDDLHRLTKERAELIHLCKPNKLTISSLRLIEARLVRVQAECDKMPD